MRVLTLFLALALANTGVSAQAKDTVVDGRNGTRIVVAGDEGARSFQQQWGYAPAVEAGGFVFLSGAIAGPASDEGIDTEAFKQGLRRTFASLAKRLEALDVSFADVVKINTYHVYESAYFDGDKMAHMEAVRAVKEEFMGDATPAWSAIGVSELFSDEGLVEIELTLYAAGKDADSKPEPR